MWTRRLLTDALIVWVPAVGVHRLLSAGQFDAAFSRVLGNSNVDLLAWLCAQVQPDEVFAGSPPSLSQGVILSLVQQLGCDLQRDASTKATWIREAALSLDPSDPVLTVHVQPILSQLYTLLQQHSQDADGAVKTDLRLCMRVVNSLLR
jgi:enhancer of mRNA-decapping protein 4